MLRSTGIWTLCLLVGAVLADPSPDVSELQGYHYPRPTTTTSRPQIEIDAGCLTKLQCTERFTGEAIHKKFVTVREIPVRVRDPVLQYTTVTDPVENPVTLEEHRVVPSQPIAVNEIRENPRVQKITTVREETRPVRVLNTVVTETARRVEDPQVTRSDLTLDNIEKGVETRTVRRPNKRTKPLQVIEYVEKKVPRVLKRQVLRENRIVVDQPVVQERRKTVKVPVVTYRTVRLAKPQVYKTPVYVSQANVRPVPRTEITEEVQFVNTPVDKHVVRTETLSLVKYDRVPKNYVKPVRAEAGTVEKPRKEFFTVYRHTANPVQQGVPCGIEIPSKTYLPAKCGPCPTCNCPDCGGYDYSPPAGQRLTY